MPAIVSHRCEASAAENKGRESFRDPWGRGGEKTPPFCFGLMMSSCCTPSSFRIRNESEAMEVSMQ